MNSNLFAKPLDTANAKTFYGIEALMYQGENFLSALATGIRKLKENGKFDTASVKAANLSEIAKRFTGMDITIQISDGFNAYMYMPPMDNAHPFHNNYLIQVPLFSTAGEMILKGKGDPIAEINYKDAKVGGVYSDVPVNIFIGKEFFKSHFSAEEVAAIILHEVGHAFTYFYYLGRMYFANFLISSYAQEIIGTRDVDRRKILIKAAERRLGTELYNPNALAEQPSLDKNKMETLFINAHRYALANTTGTDIYDFRACEQLADYFATMHGAGPHLISGLNKFYEMAQSDCILPYPIYLIGEFFKLILLPVTLPFTLLTMLVYNPSIKAYDDPAARAKYIELQMRGTLKDRKLDPSMRKSILDAIEAAGKESSRIKDHKGLDHLLWTTLSPSYRRGVKQEQAQKVLEGILFNDLYQKAAIFDSLEEYNPYVDEAVVAIAEARQQEESTGIDPDSIGNELVVHDTITEEDVDFSETSLEELELTISQELIVNPVGIAKLVWKIYKWYKRFQDSSGQGTYRQAMKLFNSTNNATFKYGIENAISIKDTKAVANYLLEHREDKFKQLFKAVDRMVDGGHYKLQGVGKTPEQYAKFIAEDIANYPNIRSQFTFSVPEPIINTLDSRTYDKVNSLLFNTFAKSGFAPFLAPFTGWGAIEKRFESVIKTLNELILSSSATKTVSLEYTPRNISTLSLTEFDFNTTSFDGRWEGYKTKMITKFLSTALSKEGWSAKSKIATQMDLMIQTTKELIRANNELTENVMTPVNKYFEEIIELTKSDDFKIK